MRVLWAVLVELWCFAGGCVKPAVKPKEVTVTDEERFFSRITDTLKTSPVTTPTRVPFTTTHQHTRRHDYRVCVGVAYIFSSPLKSFDNVSAREWYGTPLEIVGISDEWTQVKTDQGKGWIQNSHYAPSLMVLPQFKQHEMYDAAHLLTAKVRVCLHDLFGLQQSNWVLTSEEYVMYCCWLRNIRIEWGDVIGRHAGSWQTHLKGIINVHISVNPSTSAIMEYTLGGAGYLAYVHAVLPDNTLHLSGVGLLQSGRYSEVSLEESDWRELRPVFIKGV